MGGGDAFFTNFITDSYSVTVSGTTATITFQYQESTFDFTGGLSCLINESLITLSSSSGTGGNGTASFSIIGANAKYFTQGYTQKYQLIYNFIPSDFFYYYWRNAIDSNNINLAMTGNAFTAVSISDRNKSILLPPVASKPGYIYRFKITNYASPNLLRISPYFSTFNGTTSLTAGTAPYDSSIDGASSTIRLEGQNYSIAIVSDGTNWSIISLYVSSLLTPAVASVSGSSATETNPTQLLYHRSSTVFNVIIAPMLYSFIKYICILNEDTSSGIFNIYFPLKKSVDNITAGPGQRIRIALTIPASSLGTIILTYANNQYYILGYYIFGNGDNITNNTSSSAAPILTKGISFTTTIPDAGRVVNYEIPPAELSSNYSIINIVKLNNDTSSVDSVTINKPSSQGSSYFAITNTTTIKQLSIGLVNYRYSCIWLAKYYDSTYDTIILPVHYYLATANGGGITP